MAKAQRLYRDLREGCWGLWVAYGSLLSFCVPCCAGSVALNSLDRSTTDGSALAGKLGSLRRAACLQGVYLTGISVKSMQVSISQCLPKICSMRSRFTQLNVIHISIWMFHEQHERTTPQCWWVTIDALDCHLTLTPCRALWWQLYCVAGCGRAKHRPQFDFSQGYEGMCVPCSMGIIILYSH